MVGSMKCPDQAWVVIDGIGNVSYWLVFGNIKRSVIGQR